MAKPKTCGIYKITNPKGKVYIGQSVDIDRRWGRYNRLSCESQPKLYRSLNKYGVGEHSFEVIEECGIELLNTRERFYQDKFKSHTRETGLNCVLQPANGKPKVLSEDTIRKFREAQLGKTASKEVRDKMSKSQKLRFKNLSETEREKFNKAIKESIDENVSQKVIDIYSGVFYDSIDELALLIGDTKRNLSRYLNGTMTSPYPQYRVVERDSTIRSVRLRSEYVRPKMTLEHRKGISKSRMGIRFSDSHIENISKSQLDLISNPVIDTNTGVFYNSVSELARLLDIPSRTLHGWLTGEYSNKMPKYRLANDSFYSNEIKEQKNYYKTPVIDLNTGVFYGSPSELSSYIGVSTSTARNWLNGRCTTKMPRYRIVLGDNKLKGVLTEKPTDNYKNVRNNSSKIVLDLHTGVFYDSTSELSSIIGVSSKKLRKMYKVVNNRYKRV